MLQYHAHKARNNLFNLLRALVVKMALSYELKALHLVKFKALILRLAPQAQLANAIWLPLVQ
jgi:hypothetical protein